MTVIPARVHELVQDGNHRRNMAEAELRKALHHLEEIPRLAKTKADETITAAIKSYL